MICKECGKKSQSGHKFCNSKCRKAWVKRHNKIYQKKKFKKRNLLALGITGRGVFDYEGNSVDGDGI